MRLGPTPAERAAWDEQARTRFEEPDLPRDSFEHEDFASRAYDHIIFAGVCPSWTRDGAGRPPSAGADELSGCIEAKRADSPPRAAGLNGGAGDTHAGPADLSRSAT